MEPEVWRHLLAHVNQTCVNGHGTVQHTEICSAVHFSTFTNPKAELKDPAVNMERTSGSSTPTEQPPRAWGESSSSPGANTCYRHTPAELQPYNSFKAFTSDHLMNKVNICSTSFTRGDIKLWWIWREKDFAFKFQVFWSHTTTFHDRPKYSLFSENIPLCHSSQIKYGED